MKDVAPVVVSYLRFSRPEQLKGDSVRRQLALGEEWVKRHKMKIADTFRDLGIARLETVESIVPSYLSRFIDGGTVKDRIRRAA